MSWVCCSILIMGKRRITVIRGFYVIVLTGDFPETPLNWGLRTGHIRWTLFHRSTAVLAREITGLPLCGFGIRTGARRWVFAIRDIVWKKGNTGFPVCLRYMRKRQKRKHWFSACGMHAPAWRWSCIMAYWKNWIRLQER